jgi:catechol 1,2-dioxygenase
MAITNTYWTDYNQCLGRGRRLGNNRVIDRSRLAPKTQLEDLPMSDDHTHNERPFDVETRRSILIGLGIGTVGSIATAAATAAAPLPGMRIAPTAGFDLVQDKLAHPLPKPLVVTAGDILGPFWRAGAPFASDLVPPGAKGQKLVLSGTVRDTDGKPIAGVILDFWNADDDGKYDLSNPFQLLMPDAYKFRGLVRTDADGKYTVTTIVPGKYRVPAQLPGFEVFDGLLRPAHIHLMTSHNGTVPLITQIYFDGDAEIAKDPWAGKSRNLALTEKGADIWRSRFDIVLLRSGSNT